MRKTYKNRKTDYSLWDCKIFPKLGKPDYSWIVHPRLVTHWNYNLFFIKLDSELDKISLGVDQTCQTKHHFLSKHLSKLSRLGEVSCYGVRLWHRNIGFSNTVLSQESCKSHFWNKINWIRIGLVWYLKVSRFQGFIIFGKWFCVYFHTSI